MLIIRKEELARNLLAYGEQAASVRVVLLSEKEYQQVCEVGFRYALGGMHWLKAGCVAAIEVLEGRPRELRRKRRVWTDVPEVSSEPDPLLVAVTRRFEEYSGGRRLRKEEVVVGLGEALAPDLPGFRYYSSHGHFRKHFADGTSYVGLEYAHGSLSLRFGVRHEGVEAVRQRLFESGRTSQKFHPVTISKLSDNMGPGSPHWNHPTETCWPISGSEGLERASREISVFVRVIVLPYVTLHQEPSMIRDTLRTTPGYADHWRWRIGTTIFAVDCLLQRRDWLDDDYRMLRDRHLAPRLLHASQENGALAVLLARSTSAARQDLVSELAQDYETTVAKWNT